MIDGVKYVRSDEVTKPEGDAEARRQRAPRGPSLRSLVNLALRCDDATQLGEEIRSVMKSGVVLT